jgi:DNA polymerase
MSASSDPRAELFELVRAARAWVEWVHHSGADELGAESAPAELLAELEAPKVAARRPADKHAARARHTQRSERRPGQAPARPTPARAARPAAPEPKAGQPRPSAPAAKPKLPAEERRKRLAVLAEEVRTCTKCRLHESRTNTAFSRGSFDAELVFVGEGPGAEEDRQGLPFVGPAGQLLDKMIAAMGYGRDEVYIANVVKCRPPKNRKPEPDEMAACLPFLEEQLELVDPKAMIALGATGVQGLIGTRMGITRMRGTWKLYRGRIPLMPTFHPAYLLRSPNKKRDVWNDLKQVMRKLGKKPPKKRNG